MIGFSISLSYKRSRILLCWSLKWAISTICFHWKRESSVPSLSSPASKTPRETFEHLIFHSSLVSVFEENSSPSTSSTDILTSLIPCMLALHGFLPTQTSGSAFKWCFNTIKQALTFRWWLTGKPIWAKCFWKILRQQAGRDDLAQSNRHN